MNLNLNKIYLCLFLCLISTISFAYKFRPFVEFSSAFYAPYLGIKNDFNFGLHYSTKIENFISIGVGINSYLSFNIKETVVFKKKFLTHFKPLITLQFKYNNIRQYNTLLGSPTIGSLFYNNSFIIMTGLQFTPKKYKIDIQFQSGISYNFQEINDPFENLFPKEHNDIRFNSINTLSIIKRF